MSSKLNAFAPNGERVTKTLEIGVGSHEVRYFYLAEGEFRHEFGDDYEDGEYPDTATYGGSTVYLDESGNYWPAEALTLKAADGTVVREGRAIDPLPGLDAVQACELAFKADQMRGGTHELGEGDWIETVSRHRISGASQVVILEGFIREMGLMPVLAAYAKRAAAEMER
ncbi:hypothetical protein [Rubrivivax gelatinosus]|uniref:hypothetical protein n=1 Tax=Rubrivivax gelatinosus TaxID=28068 RepID=UPI0009D97A50|nr:hypothetical protein [Rubrivivax gelatinosus]MBG6083058.1 hypothetical protein [Rubrivivax gelatinosus]